MSTEKIAIEANTAPSANRIAKHVGEDSDNSEITKRQKEFEVTSLPNWGDAVKFHEAGFRQHAGLLPLSNKAEVFFWLLHSSKPRGKLLIWLNGGPGCTSTDGLILERGIFELSTHDGINTLKTRKDGWHTFTNVIAIDQPIGTGYSHGERKMYAKTLDEAGAMFDEFLTEFFKLFPEYAHDEVYMGGESFAGIWIPNFAAKIAQRPSAVKINLKGLAIGSGWIEPRHQYLSLLPVIERNQLLKGESLKKFRQGFQKCLDEIQKDSDFYEVCEDMGQSINHLSINKNEKKKTCINQYDFRLRDPYPDCGMSWPPNVEGFHGYMGSEEVAAALHAKLPGGGWDECNRQVSGSFQRDNVSSIGKFPELLKNMPILLFVGDKDLMVNNLGVEYLVGNYTLQESKREPRLRVSDPDEGIWRSWGTDPNIKAGMVAHWGRLSHATIYDASHMASFDQPTEVAGLLRWFISGQPSTSIIPSSENAPGFYIHTANVTKPTNITEVIPGVPLHVNSTDATLDPIDIKPQSSTPPPVVLGFALVATLGVLGCLVASLIRSRIRRPFNPDAQELLTTDDTELASTHFNAPSSGNMGDDYTFDFHDSDDETPVLPAL